MNKKMSSSISKFSPMNIKTYENFYKASLKDNFQADFKLSLHEKRRNLLADVYFRKYKSLFEIETDEDAKFYVLSMMKANKVVYDVKYSSDMEIILDELDKKINKSF